MNTYSDFKKYHPDEEIDLVDLWLYLQRHRWIFAVTVMVCLLAGIAAAVTMPTTYNYKLTVEIGGMKNVNSDLAMAEYLESSSSIQTRLKESIAPSVASSLRSGNQDAAFLDQLVVDVPKDAGMAIISVEATQDQQVLAFEFLGSVAKNLVETHNRVLDRHVSLLRDHAEQRLAEIDQQLADVRAASAKLTKVGNDEAAGISSILVSQQIPQLLEQRSETTQQLSVDLETNVQPSRIIAGPARSPKPESPGFLLVVALASLIGIFLACAMVMFAVLKEQAAARTRQSATRVESRRYSSAQLS